ncbi:MAG: DNA-directed RNA polymerase subunit E' [archaeon GW2011_AR3]|nr:MAG: DNA-directed RNA polymerase subunit E' [archaeon GW2011_AR3]MBS3109030.1 DNA-directed RNA polymerase subunit E'' [Candidatus Woesearchaeota archaeon]
MKKKVCKRCKLFVEGAECPVCKTSSFSTSWQGRLHILNTAESMIANKVGISEKGEYAIKVR